MATDLCTPVLKYSHAIGVNKDHTVPWTHLTASDMFMIIKGKSSTNMRDERLMLKIVHGNTESVDLGNYIDAAIDARARAQQSGIMPIADQLPIFGMTKGVCLAFRFILPDGEPQRIQMKLESEKVCRQVVEILLNRGLEFSKQHSRGDRSGSVRPANASSAVRPTSMLGAADSSSHPSNYPSTNATLPSRDFEMPHLFRRDDIEAPRTIDPVRPSTAQFYGTDTTSTFAACDPVRDISTARGDRSFAISCSPMLPTHQTSDRLGSSSQAMLPPALTTGRSNERLSDGLQQGATGAVSSGANTSGDLQYPTSNTTNFMEDIDIPFPPKRELPFKRPGSRQSGEGTSSRPGSSALSLPPLPEPKVVKSCATSTTRPNTASPSKSARAPSPARPATASPLKRVAAALEEDNQARQSMQTASELPNSNIVSSERTDPSRMNSLADAPGELVSPPQTARKQNLSTGVSAAFAGIASAVQASERVNGDDYLARSPEDRQAALEAYILSKVEDPAFKALCHDVEASWRIMALGM